MAVRSLGNAYAGGQGGHLPGRLEPGIELCKEFPGLFFKLFHAAFPKPGHQELISPKPGHKIIGEGFHQGPGRSCQHRVPHLMPICVIDSLKPVQVNVEQAHGLVPPAAMDILVKIPAVIESCKEIRVGAVEDLFFQVPLNRHIPEDAEFSNHIVEYVINGVFMNLQHFPEPVRQGGPGLHVSFAVDCALSLKCSRKPLLVILSKDLDLTYLEILLEFCVCIQYPAPVVP